MSLPRPTVKVRAALIAIALIAIPIAYYATSLLARAREYEALLKHYVQEEQDLRAEAAACNGLADSLLKDAARDETLARKQQGAGADADASRLLATAEWARSRAAEERAQAAFNMEMVEVALAAQRTYRRLARRPWLSHPIDPRDRSSRGTKVRRTPRRRRGGGRWSTDPGGRLTSS